VHKYFFERESEFFQRKLTVPASPGKEPPGTSDSTAIILENVNVEHFATFLWVFYNPKYSIYEKDVSDWEVILGLAVRWDFPEVKDLAIRELEKKIDIPDSKRIKLYHAHHVDRNILIPYYARLCEREAHLTREEGEDIGMETVIMVAAGRGEARAGRLPSGGRSPITPTVQGEELHQVIREIFGISPEVKDKDTTAEDQTKKPNGTTSSTDSPLNDSTEDANSKKKQHGGGGGGNRRGGHTKH